MSSIQMFKHEMYCTWFDFVNFDYSMDNYVIYLFNTHVNLLEHNDEIFNLLLSIEWGR